MGAGVTSQCDSECVCVSRMVHAPLAGRQRPSKDCPLLCCGALRCAPRRQQLES
jgi:hypothetical protein